MIRTVHGSCHCGAVTWKAELDLAAGSTRCNCRICTKARNWGTRLRPEAFTLLTGERALRDYTPGPNVHWLFCGTCGVRSFARGHMTQLGGDFVTIQLACLDDATPEELLSGPIHVCDGRANAWWQQPAEVRHL